MDSQEELRSLPSVDRLLQTRAAAELVERWGHELAVEALRETLDATRQAIRTANLYPVGEGAGYAGGIVSSAVDGIKTADRIIQQYAPPR